MDERLLDTEVTHAGITARDTVLEIGAGTGNLTRRLAVRAGRVIAIEYDRRFRHPLESLARSHRNVDLLWGDALTVPMPPFDKVVANLPYRVALPLVFRLLTHEFQTGVVITQRDMAKRLCAGPGQAGYSRVSVTVQRLAHTELLDTVPRGAFSPPPDVDSAMVRLRPRAAPFPVGSGERFRRLLDHCFRYRDERLAAALHRLDDASAIVPLLPHRLRTKQVRQLAPEEFGEVSRFLDAHNLGLPAVTNNAKRRAQAGTPPHRQREAGPSRGRRVP